MNDNTPEFSQLTLNVQLRDDATFENFLSNETLGPLLQAVQGQSQAGGEPIIYLFGSEGCGKSHLLQAQCHAQQASAIYLPLRELVDYTPADVLHSVENLSVVCLDDVSSVTGMPQWEEALFDLFNRCRERGSRMLVAGAASPRAVGIDLADLRSRLSWGIVYQMPTPEDEMCQEILMFRARRRGLEMSTEVARYIMSRAPRSLDALLALLDHLDAASLSEKKALTIPFVGRSLGWV